MRYVRDSINVKYHVYMRGGRWFVRRRCRTAFGTFVNHNSVMFARETLEQAIASAHDAVRHDSEMSLQARRQRISAAKLKVKAEDY